MSLVRRNISTRIILPIGILLGSQGVEAQTFLEPMQIDEGVFLTSHAVNMITDNSFFQVFETSDIGVGPIAREFYRHFPDRFDFLFVFAGMPMSTTWGAHFPVSNTTAGIGQIHPVRSLEGIELLQSLIFINFENFGTVGPVIHELAHRWGNYLDLFDRKFHWEYSDVGGVLGGHYTEFDAVGDGRFALTGFKGSDIRGGVFSELELYLMGLISATEIQREFRVIRDAEFIEKDADGRDVVSGRLERVTMDDIIAAQGPRVPNYQSSPKRFTAAVIVVSTVPLDRECMEYFDRVSMLVSSTRDHPSAFAAATGYRATLETRLDHIRVTTAVERNTDHAPETMQLMQNAPNPFNGRTSIAFTLPVSAHVELSIFNIAGQLVSSLTPGRLVPGAHELHWDGRDRAGRNIGGGTYFYRLTAGEHSQTRRLMLLP